MDDDISYGTADYAADNPVMESDWPEACRCTRYCKKCPASSSEYLMVSSIDELHDGAPTAFIPEFGSRSKANASGSSRNIMLCSIWIQSSLHDS